jgi:protein-L-isoaspartate O-methyltransferase
MGGPRDRADVEARLEAVRAIHGPWNSNIPLPFGAWTRGEKSPPQGRLMRILQVVRDFGGKPLERCRVLDLGCQEGLHSLAFGIHGAQVVGIDARPGHLARAAVARDILELPHVQFLEQDVREISLATHGRFDIILCTGVMEHLELQSQMNLLGAMSLMCTGVCVYDQRVVHQPTHKLTVAAGDFGGAIVEEHGAADTPEQMAARWWASHKNRNSFWPTRPAAIRMAAGSAFIGLYQAILPTLASGGATAKVPNESITFVATRNRAEVLYPYPSAEE